MTDADTLRRAAALMRKPARSTFPEAFRLALADWLENAAKWLLPCDEPCWERGIEGCPDCEVYAPALAVARAYLAEPTA